MPDLPPPPPPVIAWTQPAESLAPWSPDRVDVGDEPADFNLGDLEVKLRLGFTGNSLFPQTLLTAFFNWFELQLTADYAIYEEKQLSIGIGAELWLGRPWIPEAISNLEGDSGQALDWRATTRGIAARGTLHYTGLSSFDPYIVGLVGPSLDTVFAKQSNRGDARGRKTTAGGRVGAGAGISIVSEDALMGGLELRYLVATRFRSGEDVPIVSDVDGSQVDTFDVGRAQRPPRGFSWVIFVGTRF